MNTTKVKYNKNDNGIKYSEHVIEVIIPIIVNGHEWDAYCTFDILTGEFFIDRVSIFSLSQFCEDNNLDIHEFTDRIWFLFKKHRTKRLT